MARQEKKIDISDGTFHNDDGSLLKLTGERI